MNFLAQDAYYRAAGALPHTAEDTIGRNPSVRSSRPSTNHCAVQCQIETTSKHTIFFKFKIGIPLVHLKIKKYQSERPRPIDGLDLVMTEWTSPRKSTHEMKNRSCSIYPLWSACGAPMPCGAGSSIVWARIRIQFYHISVTVSQQKFSPLPKPPWWNW